MNKALFLYFGILFLGVSCSKKKIKNDPTTFSKPNQVTVLIDDPLWNGEVGDTLRNTLAAPFLGLPQEEPVLSLNQYPVKLLEGFTSNSRNIIIIKREDKSQIRFQENEYANPQIVVHISGRSVQELLDSIHQNDSLIIKRIKESEIKVYQQWLKRDTLMNTEKIAERFGISLDIPARYRMVMGGKRFIWLKKEITSGNLSLVFYQLPLSVLKNKKINPRKIIKIRDSIGRIYIHGAVPRTYMMTEKAFTPYQTETQIYKHTAFETRGTWELSHDFMGGPFINYAIIDQANQRVIFIEGFCYAPSKKKRDLLFELEAIIRSTRFLKTNHGNKV
ncbi:DUF4837 family protein [Flavobacterium sp.]|uniref:DUF4837 family protein n=1 Tax=Flavobacterium sp. TaxID=239 RepID=UPI00263204DE|nr:DUF4837 family protein [Flavobacterium sp.]